MTSEFQEDEKLGFRHIRIVAFLAIAVFLLGVALAWTASRFALPISSGLILGASITVSVMLLCCISYLMTSAYSARMPAYEEMEVEFRKGIQFFENREWQEALEVFKRLMGPMMNHKRALYYAARCCEELSDWEGVKLYSKKYLEMKSKDKEVWEMLARAHKRLFEYEEAEDALDKASRL
jgi:tetratricopeptide (TPR) repeat protein